MDGEQQGNDPEAGFWLSTETALGINVKYKTEDRFLNGCADIRSGTTTRAPRHV